MSDLIVDAIPKSLICGDNLPGIKGLYVINSDGLNALPAVDAAPNDNTISTDLTLVDGLTEVMVKWNFAPGTCGLTEPTADNGLYEPNIEAFFPKDDPVKRNLFRKMRCQCCEFTVITVDENDEVRLFDKMKSEDNFDSGKGEDAASKNGFQLRLFKTGRKGYTYTGVIPTS